MVRSVSIRWRLSLFVALGTGLILAAVVGYNFIYAHKMLRRELEARGWQMARATAGRIEGETRAVMKIVEGVSLAVSIDPPGSGEDLQALLEGTVASSPEIVGASFALSEEGGLQEPLGCVTPYAFREGGEIHYKDIAGAGEVHETLDWYFLPAELKRPVWSEPYFDVGGAEILMVTYSAPVFARDTGVFLGVFTSDVSLEGLRGLLAEMPLGPGGYAFLVSKNGTFISHPEKELILRENIFSLAEAHNELWLRKLGQRMQAGGSDFLEFDSVVTGEPCWMIYVPVDSPQWTLAALFPRSELIKEVRVLSQAQASIGIGCFVLLLLVVLLISRSMTRPIEQLDRAAQTLAGGNLDEPLPLPPGNDEIARLGRTFEQMREDLVAYTEELRATVAAKERIESELRVAHDIQMSLVPRTFPPFPERADMDLFALMEPAREVGGDFYDFFLVGDHHLCLVIGDVSGKGVPAALFMAVTRSFLRSLVRVDENPAETLRKLNLELAVDNDACMFVTLFYALVDLRTGHCRCANGGHNLPVRIPQDGPPYEIDRIAGVVAGVMGGAEYAEGAFTLAPGETFFFYTDGVTEAMDPAQALYGEDRMLADLGELAGGGSQALCEAMRERLRQFAGPAEQSDDITMMAFRYLGLGA